jgi:RNA-binding protein NOB1
LPRPKGGKHARNPVTAEYQRVPEQRASKKSLQKLNALSPEYIAGDSPFALNDVYSRSAQLGYVKHGQHSTHVDRRVAIEKHRPSRRRKKVSGF